MFVEVSAYGLPTSYDVIKTIFRKQCTAKVIQGISFQYIFSGGNKDIDLKNITQISRHKK